jgi:predicted acylesterase/phospholipase RssA
MTKPNLECDIIMKGGITSGVVYPMAAVKLAETYRFKRVGGASAGAIAAAIVAAAQYGKNNTSKTGTGGFGAVKAAAEELGTNLAGLFQPQPKTKPVFDMLMAAIEPNATTPKTIRSILTRGLKGNPVGALAGVALTAAPVFALWIGRRPQLNSLSWWACLVLSMLWVAVGVAITAIVATVLCVKAVMGDLPANGFGLVTGNQTTKPQKALTPWISEQIQKAAGRSANTQLVTFGDLWGPEATAAYRKALGNDTPYVNGLWAPARTPLNGETELDPVTLGRLVAMRDIDLVVMTTDLTHRRSLQFPFSKHNAYWCNLCLKRFFHDPIMAHLDQASPPPETEWKCPQHPNGQVRLLPDNPDIPIVLAARLSLSFPGLLSAIPLLTVDYSRIKANREAVTTWFSDGGIASNFPMHLFDEALPTRPTFGITLTGQHRDYTDPVWKPDPKASAEGIHLPAIEMTSVGGFISALLDTMQNWSDNAQMIMPGYRDRIVRVRLQENEGGMNLLMPPETIRALANRGGLAGTKLTDSWDLDRHQRIRFRSTLASLNGVFQGAHRAHDPAYIKLLQNDSWFEQMNSHKRAGEKDAVNELMALAKAWSDPKHATIYGDIPRPTSQYRSVPRQ